MSLLFLLLACTVEPACDVDYAEETDGAPDGPRLYCLAASLTSTCIEPSSDVYFVNTLVEPWIGAAGDYCTWDGEVTCGPELRQDACCYVVEDISSVCIDTPTTQRTGRQGP